MSDRHRSNGIVVTELRQFASPALAKARLLDWSEEQDARTLKARSSLGVIFTGGAFAILGGLALARAITPGSRIGSSCARATRVGTRVISWALVARAGTWLLPYVVRALQSHIHRPAAKGPGA